jgi:hypothetical protein
VEFVVVAFVGAAILAATAKLLGRFSGPKRADRTEVIDGIVIDVLVGRDTELNSTVVLRVVRIPGQEFSLLVAEDRGRLMVAIEPEDRVDVESWIGGHMRAWSNDKALARWWLNATVCERLAAAGAWWSFHVANGSLEAHARYSNIDREPAWMRAGLAACAAFASRGIMLDAEIGQARAAIADTKITLLLLQEPDGSVIKRFRTYTRFTAGRAGQGPFVLEPRLQGETRHLYDEVAPARIETDGEALHLDLDGVIVDPARVLQAARLATRLAEPMVTSLDEGPYR